MYSLHEGREEKSSQWYTYCIQSTSYVHRYKITPGSLRQVYIYIKETVYSYKKTCPEVI